jgi:hypothetical protein
LFAIDFFSLFSFLIIAAKGSGKSAASQEDMKTVRGAVYPSLSCHPAAKRRDLPCPQAEIPPLRYEMTVLDWWNDNKLNTAL